VKTPLAHWWRKGMSAGEFRPVTVTVKVEKRSIRDRNVERNPGFASEESVLSTGFTERVYRTGFTERVLSTGFYRTVGSKYLIERGWPEGGGGGSRDPLPWFMALTEIRYRPPLSHAATSTSHQSNGVTPDPGDRADR